MKNPGGSTCRGFGNWVPSATDKAPPGLPAEGRLGHVVVMVVENHGLRAVLMAAVRGRRKDFSVAAGWHLRNLVRHK